MSSDRTATASPSAPASKGRGWAIERKVPGMGWARIVVIPDSTSFAQTSGKSPEEFARELLDEFRGNGSEGALRLVVLK